jgi:hypothetical protein
VPVQLFPVLNPGRVLRDIREAEPEAPANASGDLCGRLNGRAMQPLAVMSI